MLPESGSSEIIGELEAIFNGKHFYALPGASVPENPMIPLLPEIGAFPPKTPMIPLLPALPLKGEKKREAPCEREAPAGRSGRSSYGLRPTPVRPPRYRMPPRAGTVGEAQEPEPRQLPLWRPLPSPAPRLSSPVVALLPYLRK
jgi:hypothetical protein